jgi:hypothetical protein
MWSSIGDALIYRSGQATMRVTIDGSGHPIGAALSIPMPRDAVAVGISGDRILTRVGGEVPAVHAVLTLEWARDLQRIVGPPTTALPR